MLPMDLNSNSEHNYFESFEMGKNNQEEEESTGVSDDEILEDAEQVQDDELTEDEIKELDEKDSKIVDDPEVAE